MKYKFFILCKSVYENGNRWIGYEYTRERLLDKLSWMIKRDGIHSVIQNMSQDMEITSEDIPIPKYHIVKIHGNMYQKVDMNLLLQDANTLFVQRENVFARKQKEREYYRKQRESYEFRKEPVPGIRKCGRYGYFRNMRTKNAIKNAIYVEEEYKFVDTKAKNLPTVWDDYDRHCDKNWKTSCKVRKQWMKKHKKHMDTGQMNKYEFLEELKRLEEKGVLFALRK